MKKKKLLKKLKLKKETLASLDKTQMGTIKGGYLSYFVDCHTRQVSCEPHCTVPI